MIDIHCHLLPGIDDGPADLAASLALAQALAADGITHVVCTPHVFPGRYENRRSSIQPAFDRFAAQLRAARIALVAGWAGEVRLAPEALELVARDEVPFLGRSDGLRNMLLEMPDGQVPLGAQQLTRHLLRLGIRPVIVHPERNKGVMERPEKIEPFIDDGCVVQVTAGSLVGQFGSKAQAVAHQLVDNGWVAVVASDAHNLAGRRPRMTDARAYLAQHWGADTADQLTRRGPAALCGIDLPGRQPAAPVARPAA